MEKNPCIRIGHLKIVDHLILGISNLCLKRDEINTSAINLEAPIMTSWSQLTDSLVSKELDGAFMPAPLAMDLFAQGLDIKILMFAHRSGSLIVKNNVENMKTIADFKGKTILVPSELSIQTMLLHRLLSSAGLSFENHENKNADVMYEVVAPFIMAEMLACDQEMDIAGFSVAEPFASIAIDQGIAQKVCTTASLWNDHPCCVFVLKKEALDNNRQAVSALIDLFIQAGQQLTHTDNQKTMAMAEAFLGIDIKVIRQMIDQAGIRFDPHLLIPQIAPLNMIQNYMANTMHILEKKADLSVLVDDSLVSHLIPGNRL